MGSWQGKVHRRVRSMKDKAITLLWHRYLFGKFGSRSTVCSPFYTHCPENIEIGERVYIQPNCRIETNPPEGGAAQLKIGNGVVLGHGVLISAVRLVVLEDDVIVAGHAYVSDNNYTFDPEGPRYGKLPLAGKPTVIGKGAFIGKNACILAGSTIGERSVIGAGSVVRGTIPPYCMAAGSPARVVKRYCFERKSWVKADERPARKEEAR